MVNIIWGVMIIIGVIFGIASGNKDVINNEILKSSKEGLNIVMEILPLLVVWMGLMKIAEKSGLLDKISNFLSKPLRLLFPSVPKGNKAIGYIASNVAVNMLGLGSAATPFGLKAMEELQKINKDKKVASDAMITFLILNTAGVTIIPTTVIALRTLHGSSTPTSIILPSIIATFCGSIIGLFADYLIRRKNK